VQQSGVAQVGLRALRQSLLDIGVIGPKAPNHEGLLEHVEVAAHGVGRNRERSSQVGDVQQVAVDVSQHRPEGPQPNRRQPHAVGGQVALEVTRDVRIEPVEARLGRPAGVQRRKAAPEPARRLAGPVQFARPKGRELHERHAAREAFLFLTDGIFKRQAFVPRPDHMLIMGICAINRVAQQNNYFHTRQVMCNALSRKRVENVIGSGFTGKGMILIELGLEWKV